MLIGQEIEVAVDRELDRDAEATAEVAHVPLERGLEAEVIEHARPEAEREVADGADHVVDELRFGTPATVPPRSPGARRRSPAKRPYRRRVPAPCAAP